MLSIIKKKYFILLSTFFFLYFFLNLLDGQRGLISYFEKKQILDDFKKQKNELTHKINNLDIKNSLLTDNLDIDYIETLIRQKFLFGKNGETLYIINKNEN